MRAGQRESLELNSLYLACLRTKERAQCSVTVLVPVIPTLRTVPRRSLSHFANSLKPGIVMIWCSWLSG